MNSSKIESSKKFFVSSNTKNSVNSFFQRMGSMFLAIVNPKDVDESGKLRDNTLSSGPYVLLESAPTEIILIQNKYWNGHTLENAPLKITIKKPEFQSNFIDFLHQKTWENITQISTMMPSSEANLLTNKSFPMWTRDHDRVSLFRPVGGALLNARKSVLVKLWREKNKYFEKVKLPMNSIVANSLQPCGYPLFENLTPADHDDPSAKSLKEVRIAAPDSIATRTQMELINPLFKELKIEASWVFLQKEKFIPLLSGATDVDFLFFDFGVADPEPITWVSLIVDMKFAFLDAGDENNLKKIIHSKSTDKSVIDLRIFLSDIGKNCGYAPMFHFSTLSVAQPGISFEQIKNLDETVDYSKILFK